MDGRLVVIFCEVTDHKDLDCGEIRGQYAVHSQSRRRESEGADTARDATTDEIHKLH